MKSFFNSFTHPKLNFHRWGCQSKATKNVPPTLDSTFHFLLKYCTCNYNVKYCGTTNSVNIKNIPGVWS